MAVEGLQHAALARSLLPRQARVGRYSAAVKCGKQPINRLEPVEAFKAERHERGYRRVTCIGAVKQELHALFAAKLEEEILTIIRESRVRIRLRVVNRRQPQESGAPQPEQ